MKIYGTVQGLPYIVMTLDCIRLPIGCSECKWVDLAVENCSKSTACSHELILTVVLEYTSIYPQSETLDEGTHLQYERYCMSNFTSQL